MTTDGVPLFGSTALAERIERVEAQLITTATEAARLRVGATAQVELSNLADPAIGAALTGRGYRRRHHAAGIEIAAECSAPGFSPALHPCGAREAAELIRTVRSITA